LCATDTTLGSSIFFILNTFYPNKEATSPEYPLGMANDGGQHISVMANFLTGASVPAHIPGTIIVWCMLFVG
jgi:hypothetical protein